MVLCQLAIKLDSYVAWIYIILSIVECYDNLFYNNCRAFDGKIFLKMNFSEKVYYLCKKIPKGKVSTYKEIAKAMKTKAYRAVGNALNKNPYKEVPCHRVINSKGHLHGFARGIRKKEKMLVKEGVMVKNDMVDLRKYLYKF